ncbi:MAG: hypothetical protein RL757_1300 [Bacteroidota bacterium]|jgi:mono/diheme cytochrome c family protein
MQRSKILFVCFSLLTAFLVSESCKHKLPEPLNTGGGTGTGGGGTGGGGGPVIDTTNTWGWRCSPDSVYYQFDIQPLLNSYCNQAGCHNATARAGNVNLSSYAATMASNMVVAGNPNNSKLYTQITRGRMPPAGYPRLSAAQTLLINKWISQGAKNLTCNPSFGVCDTTAANTKFSTFVLPIMQSKCNGCHANASTGGGILLTNYTQVKAQVTNGKLMGSMNFAAGFSAMPKNGQQLPSCELSKIQAWVRRGAPND